MKNIDAYETDAVVDATASVRISQLPFAQGERVHIRIERESSLSAHHHSEEEILRSRAIREKRKGSILRYDLPFGPAVPAEDWDAINGTGRL